MNEEPLRMVILTEERSGATAAERFAEYAASRTELETDIIDLSLACLPEVPRDGSAVRDLAPWLADADAFVVVTAEINRGYSGSVKNAIDCFAAEWRAKPVGFVAYGAPTGGRLAVEQLRSVFGGLHAMTVPDVVGDPFRVEDAERMTNQLVWWGRALRAARPYTS
ncbi:NAD(P)H-dependent oxidoreductase [Nocardia uniformis]|uniref:NAD(P)H-dependent oxidoreductase n=1 Tax=Nocardia uniformis TaxID=53432 RepID=A0A849CGC9_9NOCA|nr:NAD(P)H-dependent oxidoreductase [Nocardia uniformis]NNH75925.1 NAD(P)H-dependent oxidoreductase [Nocardia uniformis]